MMTSSRWKSVALAGLSALVLGGCAALTALRVDVSSFGEWPSARKPGTYGFERLPSQQANAAMQDQLEQAARPAVEAAGFTAAAPGTEPDVLVQVGARVMRADASPWDDPLWWRGGFGYYGGRRGWMGPHWGFGLGWGGDLPRYEREVALLLRDRATGKPLYETRASSDGSTAGGTEVLGAMYGAAMKDFPAVGLNPRKVVVELPR